MKILLICIALSLITISSSVSSLPASGLVLYLSFDKNTIQDDKAKDQSPEGNTGVINGKAETVEGKYGDALLFDGIDDFVEIPLTPSITFTKGSSLTVQAWVRTSDSPTQNDGIVGNYRQSTEALWMLSVSGDDAAKRGKMGFSVRDVGKVSSAGVTSANFLNDDKWYHLVGVRDQEKKKVRLYVNGELQGEADDNTGDINSKQSVWAGEHLNRFYKGIIDEVAVWNRPLSAAEVKSAMQGQMSVEPGDKTATLWGSIKIVD